MKLIDLTGKQFGKLLVLDRNTEKQSKYVHWNCLCECGNRTVVESQNLKTGHTKSCGHCERFELIDNDIIRCILPNKKFFLFDAEDELFVKQHKWTVAKSGYVETTVYDKGEYIRMRLHRILLDVPEGMMVDHINGNRWDNRKSNLRIASNADNIRNHRRFITNTSGYTGVSFVKDRGKYAAYITVNNIKKHLGYFTNPIMASRAYDQAAVFYYGEFARPNFKGE